MRIQGVWSCVGIVALLTGCGGGGYLPPSGRANLGAITSVSMQESFAAKPAAVFPASIAAVRVQASDYRNYRTQREGGVYGHGQFSVVTVKEIEEEADVQRIAKLPEVGGLATISTMLLPHDLQSDRELREAAARLKADMLLLYTFETSFHENDALVALNVVTLGLAPTKTLFINVVASALLIDTRTGFIYASFEAGEKRKSLTNGWESDESADRQRRDAEKAAFKSLVNEFEKKWPDVIVRAKQGA